MMIDGPLERLEEQVDRIFVSTLSSNLLSAIAARLSRQKEQATEVHILELEVETEREAFETRIMMTSCTPLEFHLSTQRVGSYWQVGWRRTPGFKRSTPRSLHWSVGTGKTSS